MSGAEKTEKVEIKNLGDFWRFFRSEMKPKGPIFTPFNIISAPVIVIGLALIVYRLAIGLGDTTNMSDVFPWGIWKGAIVMSGIAIAGGGYTLGFVVYITGKEKWRPILRETVLFAFLCYVFYAPALLIEIGRWWNFQNPFIGYEFGVSSVLFIVAWHFVLYMITLGLEFSPAAAEWVGMKRVRKIVGATAVGAVALGVMLSIHHQAGLGALISMGHAKLHPLWYTEFIPGLFFFSSIFAGPSMMIIVSSITQKVFSHRVDEEYRKSHSDIVVGLGRMCAGVMFAYLFLTFILAHHEGDLKYINTPMGYWWLTEVIGFGLIPMFLFIHGVQNKNISTIQLAAILAVIGAALNRFNCAFIAYNWRLPLEERYYPYWMEVVITFGITFLMIWIFRWIINRMHVLSKQPEWAAAIDKH
jgi:Ni/Fe-hydrogenase subunit HybB-like protein